MPAPAKWYANVPRAFALVFRAYPAAALAISTMTIFEGLLPLAQAWVAKLIVDGVVAAAKTSAGAEAAFRAVLPWLLAELGLVTLGAVISQVQTLLNHLLDSRVRGHVQTLVMGKAIELELAWFEDSAFYDMMQSAANQADSRAPALVRTALAMGQSLITLVSFAVVLFAFSPLLTVVLLAATIPGFIARKHLSDISYNLETRRATERRQMIYYEILLTKNTSVKEVKMFGLGAPMLRRYLGFFEKWFAEDSALARKRGLTGIALGLLANLAYYGAYAWVVYRAVGGGISIGEMTMYLTLFTQTQGAFSGVLGGWNDLYEGGLFMNNLYGFLSVKPITAPPAEPKPVPTVIRHGIEFRNVSFQYANREGFALRDVSLLIRPGEKLALVGANGAGKSTFIKLMTRLYDPTAGSILLDGTDLREFDVNELRRLMSVVFQDFVEYSATISENIGFGDIAALDDHARIEEAASKGGADEVVATLPLGYDTQLGWWDEHATSLSGGQWQKLAISRAFMRDAQILVLDEPTSALDAEKEYDLFKRFRTLTEGRISVLISHRFSTVRIADRIAVLDQGRMIELGSHTELLQQGGTYAKLFNLQAEGYR